MCVRFCAASLSIPKNDCTKSGQHGKLRYKKSIRTSEIYVPTYRKTIIGKLCSELKAKYVKRIR